MAHDERTKAQAMALLMLGNAPRYVVKQTGVPYTTIKRWQGESFKLLRDLVGPVDLGGFDFSNQNGHKKK